MKVKTLLLVSIFISFNLFAQYRLYSPFDLSVLPATWGETTGFVIDSEKNIVFTFHANIYSYISNSVERAREKNKLLSINDSATRNSITTIKSADKAMRRVETPASDVWLEIKAKNMSLKNNALILKVNGEYLEYEIYHESARLAYLAIYYTALKSRKNIKINLSALKSTLRQRYLAQSELIQVL
jgi:CRISPR/Cas system-associated exonuclease Cas4 (RecB family)